MTNAPSDRPYLAVQPESASTKRAWTAPHLRCLPAAEAETGLLVGPEVFFLLS